MVGVFPVELPPNTPTWKVQDAPRVENTALIPKAVVTDDGPRCWRCRRKLCNYATRPWEIVCSRCSAVNANAPSQ